VVADVQGSLLCSSAPHFIHLTNSLKQALLRAKEDADHGLAEF